MILCFFHKENVQVIVEEDTKEDVITNAIDEASYAEPLTAEEIRWFYKDGVDKRWAEFCGYDSLRIEKIYQDRQNSISKSNDGINSLPPAEKIVVRGGMYDVEIDNMKCVSIYWPGEYHISIIFYMVVLLFMIICFVPSLNIYELQSVLNYTSLLY